MDQCRLYLVEVSVDKIMFSPPYVHFPSKDKINIFVTFQNLLNMHMQSEDCAVSEIGALEFPGRELKLDFRQSQEFYCNAETLLLALNEAPLDMYFTAKWKPVPLGKMIVPWTLGFWDLVEKSRWYANNQLKPVIARGTYPLYCSDGVQIGDVDVGVVLSCPAVSETIL